MNGEAKHVPSIQGNVIRPKQKAVLTQAAAGMTLEGIMLSDVSQTRKDKQCLIHSYKAPRAVRTIETESRIVGAGTEGGKMGGGVRV